MSTQARQPYSSAAPIADSSEPTTSPHFSVRWGALLIAAVAILIYWPALRGKFIFDDDSYVTENPLIVGADGLYRFWLTTEPVDYYPISNTTLWLEWRIWGSNSVGYHVTNVLLHIASALLIWAVLQKLAMPGAFLAALLFTVHPVNAESAAWIAQRKDMLAIVFFLLSIVWFLRALEPPTTDHGPRSNTWYWLSLLAFVLAMLSKGSVAILPPALLGLIWWRRRTVALADVWATLPYFLVAILLTAVNVWFQTHGTKEVMRSADFAQRLAGAGAVVWFYLSKALVPIHLLFIYPMWNIVTADPLWWLPLAAAAAVTFLLWRQAQAPTALWPRSLWLSWGFFCLALVPVLGFVDSGFMRYSAVADHYQHIALLAVVSPLAAGLRVWHDRAQGWLRFVAAIAAAAVVCVFAALTWQQCRLYDNDIRLYEVTLKDNPDCWIAHFNVANSLMSAGRLDDAIEHYRQALRVKPDYAGARYNLGIALAKANKMQDAIVEFERTLLLWPSVADIHNNLGNALLAAGRPEEAIEHYLQAVRLKPESGASFLNLANAYAGLHRSAEAVATAEQALGMARSRGDDALAKQFEDWIANYRAQQATPHHAAGSSADPAQK